MSRIRSGPVGWMTSTPTSFACKVFYPFRRAKLTETIIGGFEYPFRIGELLTEKAGDNSGHRLIIPEEMAGSLAEEMQTRGKKALEASLVGSLLSLNETSFVKVKYLSICQDEFTMKFPEVVSFACALQEKVLNEILWPEFSEQPPKELGVKRRDVWQRMQAGLYLMATNWLVGGAGTDGRAGRKIRHPTECRFAASHFPPPPAASRADPLPGSPPSASRTAWRW